MVGFLDDYEVDLDDFNDSGGFDVPDGTYEYELLKAEVRTGTANDEDAVHIVLSFSLENGDGETFSWNWWLRVPDDPSHPTRRESISMSDWKKFLLGAGVPENRVNKAGPDDVEGITGTVRMVTGKPNKQGTAYQNPRDWTFDTPEDREEPAPKKGKDKKGKAALEPEEEPAPKKETKRSGNPFAAKK